MQNKAGQFVAPDRGRTSPPPPPARLGRRRRATTCCCSTSRAPKSWPITGATFILMHKKQADAANGARVLKFFDWAYKNGDAAADAAGLCAAAGGGEEHDPQVVGARSRPGRQAGLR